MLCSTGKHQENIGHLAINCMKAADMVCETTTFCQGLICPISWGQKPCVLTMWLMPWEALLEWLSEPVHLFPSVMLRSASSLWSYYCFRSCCQLCWNKDTLVSGSKVWSGPGQSVLDIYCKSISWNTLLFFSCCHDFTVHIYFLSPSFSHIGCL